MSEAMSKRPDEVLDYVFDFSRWLSAGDTITAATASVTSSAAIDRVLYDDTTATAWIKDGDAGDTAELVVHVTTVMGRHKDAVLRLRIVE